MQYRREKKGETHRIGSALRQGEVGLFKTATTPCDGFATVFTFDDVMPPADRCSIRGLYFCWFRRHCLYVRCTIRHYAELFDATLHRLCVRCATRRYPEPFDATLHRLCTVLQMSAKLFVIELVHFTISCSNSTWATGPFIIWLDYSCLGCSVS